MFIAYGLNKVEKQTLYVACCLLLFAFLRVAIRFFQNMNAHEEQITRNETLLPRLTLTCRDGVWSKMLSNELVPGDLVKITVGSYVPADAVLI